MKRNGLLGTSIDAFATLRTRYSRPASSHMLFINRERGTGFHALITLHTFFGIDSNLEYIELIGKRLERPHRAEQSTLCSSFCEYRQNDHETQEK